jgi:hypothetical protein
MNGMVLQSVLLISAANNCEPSYFLNVDCCPIRSTG